MHAIHQSKPNWDNMNLDPAALTMTPATAPAAKPAAKPDPRASSLLLIRHVTRALALFTSCCVWYVYTIVTPKPIYH